jgi:hypothetical protein
VIRVLLGDLVLLLAGHGVLRLAGRDWPVRAYGPLAALGLSWLAGVAALGTLTTLVGVLGGRTTPLPVVAPVLALVAVAGLLPPARFGGGPRAGRPAWPGGRAGWLGEAACGVFAAAVGARLVAVGASAPVLSNDEYAIWMLRGRALSQLGHLDPRVFTDTGAGYPQLEYPLVFPSLVAWGDGWAGRPTDAAAHLGVAALLVALLAVVGGLVARLAGPLPALASVVLVAAVPTVLSSQALRLMADVPVFAFSLALAVVLLRWLHSPSRPLLVAAAALGAGAAGTKVEGLVFTVMAFAAALAVARGGRRWLLAAGGAVLLADLPWLGYAQAHGLRSWVAQGDNLTLHHVRAVLPFTGRVLRGMVDRWPGGDSAVGVALLLALVPAAVLAIRVGRAGRLVAFVGAAVLLDALALAAQYLVSAHVPASDPVAVRLLDAQLAVTVFRVALVPAALLLVAVPILAGLALAAPRAAAPPDPPPAGPPAETVAAAEVAEPAEEESAGPDEPAGTGMVPAVGRRRRTG